MLSSVIVLLYLVSCCAFKGWVDPDTPEKFRTLKSYTDGKTYDVVMSDEFNTDGREFQDGADPVWTAIDKPDDDQTANGKKSLQYYNSTMVTTRGGQLIIKTNDEDTKWRGWNPYKLEYENMMRHFKSGMVQSWQKFCFTGGIIEIDVQWPGRHDVGGLWPAVWLLGNLGRATYESSTNLMWPWSYEKCDRNLQKAQIISGCAVTSHYALKPNKGRGATEIDIAEVMAGDDKELPIVSNDLRRPYSSMTLQLAPGIPANKNRPPSGTLPEWGYTWYKNLSFGEGTSINPFFYGTFLAATKAEEPIGRSKDESYQCDALGSMVQLGRDHFEATHTFRLEWQPGENGYLHWYMDGKFRYGIEQEGLDFMGTQIPREPSYLIMNTAISTSWGFPNPPPGCGDEYDCKKSDKRCGFAPDFCKTLPAEMKIDHVRVFQNKEDPIMTVSCDPKDYPTKRYIAANDYLYSLATEPHSLKPVKTGGGECTTDYECGPDGAGKCGWAWGSLGKRCRCEEAHTGPHCMSMKYQNDSPDWDRDDSMLVVITPYLPSFLGVSIVVAFVVLSIATCAVVRKRRYNDESIPNWL